uniref:Uncharacterized protein n=1 Tax=Fagus sylvatica TaxID=28930 RepID=A0A2N9HI23_FAGSY
MGKKTERGVVRRIRRSAPLPPTPGPSRAIRQFDDDQRQTDAATLSQPPTSPPLPD